MIAETATAAQIAAQTASMLLEIEAVKLQPNDPFTWASGWKSPIYCDNRIILSHPASRRMVREAFCRVIEEVHDNVDCIAGVATAGIAHGILVAEALNKDFVYVRSKPKGHGRRNQIEGFLKPNARVVVIEDLVSTGGSSLGAVAALKEEGAHILGLGAIFSYGFSHAHEAFENAQCPWFTLSDYEHLLPQAIKEGAITQSQLGLLKSWREAPSEWQGA